MQKVSPKKEFENCQAVAQTLPVCFFWSSVHVFKLVILITRKICLHLDDHKVQSVFSPLTFHQVLVNFAVRTGTESQPGT